MRITKIYKTDYKLNDKLENNVFKDWFNLQDELETDGCALFEFLSILSHEFLTEFEVCCIMNEFNAWRNERRTRYGC